MKRLTHKGKTLEMLEIDGKECWFEEDENGRRTPIKPPPLPDTPKAPLKPEQTAKRAPQAFKTDLFAD